MKSGNLIDCVKAFSRRIAGNFTLREEISSLLSVDKSTPHKWFDELALPKGENLLKLLMLLEIVGYDISESEELAPEIRDMGKIISLGILDIDEAGKFIGFEGDAGHHLLRVLLGRCGLSEEKSKKAKECVAMYEHEIAEKTKEWRKVIEVVSLSDAQAKKEETPLSPNNSSLDHLTMLAILANLVKAATPLAEIICSDEFSDQERDKLRELSANGHSNNVFRLSTFLNRLCSKTARREM